MADRKITDLTALAAGSQATGDLLTIVDVSEAAATDKNKKITVESLFKGIPGDVGIGTASPAFGAGSGLEIEKAGSATLRIEDSSLSSGFEIQNASGSINFNGYNSQPLIFKHNTSERLRIDSSGTLTVGPQYDRLNVNPGSGSYDGDPTAVVIDGRTNDGNATAFKIDRYDGSGSASTKFLINYAGNTGIGTASPGHKLVVSQNNSGGIAAIHLPEDESTILGSNANTNIKMGGNMTVSAGGVLVFNTNGSEAARIDSSGRLAVGTTVQGESSADNLTLADSGNCGLTIRSGTNNGGSVYFSDATSGDAQYDGYISYNHPNQFFVFGTGSTERMRLTSDGKLGVGTTEPISTLDVRGGISVLSGQAIGSTASGGTLQIQGGATLPGGSILLGGGSGNNDIKFSTDDTERMRLDSSGRLLVGLSSARSNFYNSTNSPYIQLEGNDNNESALAIIQDFDAGTQGAQLVLAKNNSQTIGSNVLIDSGDQCGTVSFQGNDGTQFVETASIIATIDGTPGANDMPGRLEFRTTADGAASPTERGRFTSLGSFLVGQTNASFGNAGHILTAAGQVYHICSGNTVLLLNRQSNDGELVRLAQDGNTEGNITVSGSTVSYNGGHLARWSQLAGNAERTEILRGSVLSNLDEMCEWGEEDNEQLNRMKVSDVEGDVNVSGVFQAWDDDDDTYTNDFYCAMTGDFVIRIAQGTTVARGDLLMSAGDGTAKPQDDDIVRSKTIAKVTSTTVSTTYADGSYCVPCVLMAC